MSPNNGNINSSTGNQTAHSSTKSSSTSASTADRPLPSTTSTTASPSASNSRSGSASGPASGSTHVNDRNSRTPSIFTIPAPLRRLFDRFPLVTYPENELPARSPRSVLRLRIRNGVRGEENKSLGNGDGDEKMKTLFVFTTEEEARIGKASFNPGCLKWQAYLKFCNVSFSTLPSNNHASPSGVLPFLLPSLPPAAESPASAHSVSVLDEHLPIPTSKLQDWAATQPGAFVPEEPNNLRYDAYLSLLDFRIRHAWLYNLYLDPQNFSSVAYPLYILPVSSNPAVRATLSSQLQRAAAHELLTHQASSGSSGCVTDLNSPSWSFLGNTTALAASYIDVDDLYGEAENAFDALNKLLGDGNEWFFGQERPGMFDASVFAYTSLLLRYDADGSGSDAPAAGGNEDDKITWQERRLVKALKRRKNLVRHCKRIEELYF